MGHGTSFAHLDTWTDARDELARVLRGAGVGLLRQLLLARLLRGVSDWEDVRDAVYVARGLVGLARRRARPGTPRREQLDAVWRYLEDATAHYCRA